MISITNTFFNFYTLWSIIIFLVFFLPVAIYLLFHEKINRAHHGNHLSKQSLVDTNIHHYNEHLCYIFGKIYMDTQPSELYKYLNTLIHQNVQCAKIPKGIKFINLFLMPTNNNNVAKGFFFSAVTCSMMPWSERGRTRSRRKSPVLVAY